MFSFQRRSDDRARRPTTRRSFSKILRLKLFFNFFNDKPQLPSSAAYAPPLSPCRVGDIGRPRQLRVQRNNAEECQRPIHYIQCLPVEILALIFVLGAEDDAFFPVTVSHVSRAWRKVALRTPALWKRITLSPQERMWKERIRRAKACPLDIELLPPGPRGGIDSRGALKDPYAIQWHMHMALPYIARWRSLEIAFPDYAPHLWKAALSRCCAPRDAAAPLLEDLRLAHRSNDDPHAFTLFSGSAPNLRSASLAGIRLNWLPSLFGGLTYLNYTHHGFSAGHQAVQDLVDMLHVSTRLIELNVAFPRKSTVRLPGRKAAVTTKVSLPWLQKLHLRVEGKDIPFELAQLAALLITPSLTSLRLADPGRSHHSFTALKSFFYGYALPPSLRALRIECGWYDPRMITPIAQAHPRVRQIAVKRPHVPAQILHVRPVTPKSKAPAAGFSRVAQLTLPRPDDRSSHARPAR